MPLPTFPACDDPTLPPVLQPWQPRHYLLLAEWLFLRPSRLKQYLYRDDETRRAERLKAGLGDDGLFYAWRGVGALGKTSPSHPPTPPGSAVGAQMWAILVRVGQWLASVVQSWQQTAGVLAQAWQRPAYRHLMIMGVVTALAGSFLLNFGVMFFGGAAWDILLWAKILALGSVICILIIPLFCYWDGLASGLLISLAMLMLVWVGLGLFPVNNPGIPFGLALGLTWSTLSHFFFGAEVGVALGVLLFAPAVALNHSPAAGIAFLVMALRLPSYVLGWPSVFLAWLSRVAREERLLHHPALQDEGMVLPYPDLPQLLERVLVEKPEEGLRATRALLRNPFQRWVVGRAWARYLSGSTDPLRRLYRAITWARMMEALNEPLHAPPLAEYPPALILLLAEVGGVFRSGGVWSPAPVQQGVWLLTRVWRGQAYRPLALLAALLADLIPGVTPVFDTVTAQQIQAAVPKLGLDPTVQSLLWELLHQVRDEYLHRPTPRAYQARQALRQLPQGEEVWLQLWKLSFRASEEYLRDIAARARQAQEALRGLLHAEEIGRSLVALTRLAGVGNLRDLAATGDRSDDKAEEPVLAWLRFFHEQELRPQVMGTLRVLADIATSVRRAQLAQKDKSRELALTPIVTALVEIQDRMDTLPPPERALIEHIRPLWKHLVTLERERVAQIARADARQFVFVRDAITWPCPARRWDNPFQAARPVSGALFVGREEVLRHIKQLWADKPNPDSILLYGHRRMGKSSLLRALEPCARSGSLLVYASLSGMIAYAQSTAHVLRAIADEVVAAALRRNLRGYARPRPADYATDADAVFAFRALLRSLGQTLQGGSLILALDELDTLDDAVVKWRVSAEVYDYLRDLAQQPGVALVLAGQRTLAELAPAAQRAFLSGLVSVRVSYLSRQATERLLTAPVPGFRLPYHTLALDAIYNQTNGQPLLVQRVGQELVNKLNRELFDAEELRHPCVLLSDAETVLAGLETGEASSYLESVWQDHIAGRAEAEKICRILVGGHKTEAELVQQSGLDAAKIKETLRYLEQRDLITLSWNHWALAVPLLQRWIRTHP